jgi:hypothetical protein
MATGRLSATARLALTRWAVTGLMLLIATGAPTAAWAHASDKGFVLLLPTGYYLTGGTCAVAASFLLVLLVPQAVVRRAAAWRLDVCTLPRITTAWTSTLAFLALGLLLVAGWFGSRDPWENPLPLVVWTVWWGGVTVAHALFGNLWSAINPWVAPYQLLRRAWTGRMGAERPFLTYPSSLGYGPAVLGFFLFAWFELIYPAPDDPTRLAMAVVVYSGVTLAGMFLFGERIWLARGECFSVFFGFVALIAPVGVDQPDSALRQGRRLYLTLPGAQLTKHDALPRGSVLFVLLTLATVSFDGLNKTFWWLGLGAINPLEYPGRTAVMWRNSLGLLAMWIALMLGYSFSIALGRHLARDSTKVSTLLRVFVLSLFPISIGYHFAHYLTSLLINGQYAVLAISDPFERGWDLLGLGHTEAQLSFLSDYRSVSVIWRLQAAVVVFVHILGVMTAHTIAVERNASSRAAMASQLPLAAFMIGYTLFGLWLLAAPAIG